MPWTLSDSKFAALKTKAISAFMTPRIVTVKYELNDERVIKAVMNQVDRLMNAYIQKEPRKPKPNRPGAFKRPNKQQRKMRHKVRELKHI